MSAVTARNRIDCRRRSRGGSIPTEGARLRADGDFYVEPVEAVEALIRAERFEGNIYDPACGEGTIPCVFHRHGYTATGSDIVERGPAGCGRAACDFLAAPISHEFANIVCNPPFKLAEPFIRKALLMAHRKVAMLLRLAFLEGQRRAELFVSTPLARVHVFSWRISMPPGGQNIKATGGSVAFAWFVWERGYEGPPTLHWLCRAALGRVESDAQEKVAALPLFER